MTFLFKLWIAMQEDSLWKIRSISIKIWPLRTSYWKILLLGYSLTSTWKHGSHVSSIPTFWNWIVSRIMEKLLFQPFDREGLVVQPLKLKVNPAATFRMQPCHFIREGIMIPFKDLLDQSVSEGVQFKIIIVISHPHWSSLIRRMGYQNGG